MRKALFSTLRLTHSSTWACAAMLLMASAAICLLTGCSPAPQWRLAEGAVWNTTYRIVYKAPADLSDSIQAVMSRVEMSLSPFNSASLISRINRNETDSTDALVDSVFAVSRTVWAATHGRFDPTVSPLVNLWGFGYDSAARREIETVGGSAGFAVAQERIDSALQLVGMGDCAVAGGRITKKHPATSFNFSAVTKGFGCDLIAAMLRRNGSADHMVEIGGEIALDGRNPQGEPWHIQIDAPLTDSGTEPTHRALTVIELSGRMGVATSGNYRNFHSTRRYGNIGHTIDPLTGYPVQTDVASATIIAPSAAMADAWATASMATGTEILSRIDSMPGVECLLVKAAPDSTFITLTSSAFPR